MISHEYKCIFIHIPRTGGTSIENALDGEDWMINKPNEKHVTTGQARKLYGEEVWNNYFKFSFVRNPWDRIVALWMRPWLSKGMSLKEYILKYKPEKHEPQSPFYSDILDLNIDFIGRYESLQEDFYKVCDMLKIKRRKLSHMKETPRHKKHYSRYYNNETRELVAKIYAKDIKKFGYEFECKKYFLSDYIKDLANELKYFLKGLKNKIQALISRIL